MLQSTTDFDADDFFGFARLTCSDSGGNGRAADVGADLKNISRTAFGEVIDKEQHIEVQHRCDFCQAMAYFLISILHQSVHQLKDLAGLSRVSTSRIGLREHGPSLLVRHEGASCSSHSKFEVLARRREIREVRTRVTTGARYCDQFGLWLSLVERLVRDQEAVGSNPTSPIIFVRNSDALRLLPHFFLM